LSKQIYCVYSLLIFVVLSVMLNVPAFCAEMPESEIKTFMKQAEIATQQRNYSKVAGLMAPDAVILFNLNGKTTELNRNQYYINATMGSKRYSNYAYRSDIESIAFKGKNAIVSATGYERITKQPEGTIYCKMKQTSVLEKRNGKLQIVRYVVNGVISKEPLF
jgi:hypothetical protein